MNRFFRSLTIAAIAVSLVGCGGGSSSTENEQSRGALQFQIIWPEQTRLIPSAANSIKVSLAGPTPIDQVVPRPPANQTSSTVNLNNLIVGSYTLTATAYPNADGTGTAQSQGSSTAVIQRDQTTSTTLVMDSTISNVSLTTPPGVSVGSTISIAGTATNATGNIVLTANDKWSWTSSNPAVASVSTTGNPAIISGLTEGNVTITGKENESGKSTTLSVAVAFDKGTLNLSIR